MYKYNLFTLVVFTTLGVVQLMAQPLNNYLTFDGINNYVYLNKINNPGNKADLLAYNQLSDKTGNNNTNLENTSSTETNDPTFENKNPITTFNLKVYLEGAYDPVQNTMSDGLLQKQVVPPGQPYSGSPWNYPGTEGAGWLPVDYPAGTVDWVLVSLREALDPETEVARAAAVLLQDGSISFNIDLNGSTSPLYVMIEHRNHLPIISPQAIPIVNNTVSYDFTLSNSYNLTGFGQKQVGSNWMMFAGNGDQDGINSCDINAADRIFWQMGNGLFGVYNSGDYNLDSDINAADRIVFNANNGIFTTIPKSTTDAPGLTCPAPNFELDQCSFTVNWTHNHPTSTTVNYDLRINGIDPGPSVVYPAVSNTVNFCNLLGISSGSGSFEVKLLYWYDGI